MKEFIWIALLVFLFYPIALEVRDMNTRENAKLESLVNDPNVHVARGLRVSDWDCSDEVCFLIVHHFDLRTQTYKLSRFYTSLANRDTLKSVLLRFEDKGDLADVYYTRELNSVAEIKAVVRNSKSIYSHSEARFIF